MRRLFVHVGYPKTGTTTLQRRLFDPLHRKGKIFYLGMFGFENDVAPDRENFFKGLTRAVYLENNEDFAAQLPELREQLAVLLSWAPVDLPVVLSNEHFTLSQKCTKQSGLSITPARTFRRLAAVFEGQDVRFLLCLRRQDDLAQALFLEHYSRRTNLNLSDFSDVKGFVRQISDENGLMRRAFDFDGVEREIRAHFPDVSILIWLFEDFRENNADIVARVLRYIGVPPESAAEMRLEVMNAKTARSVHPSPVVKRLAHAVLPAGPLRLLRELGLDNLRLLELLQDDSRLYMTPADRAVIRATWAVSNSHLAARHRDLEPLMQKFGYLGKM